MRPLVGLTTYCEPARWGAWDLPAHLLPSGYAEAVWAAGGEPVLLPSGAGGPGVVGRLDAIVLTGGADIDPQQYGASPHPRSGRSQPARDRAELALVDAALEARLPVLGVCRGMQLLNVALGGDLVQHVPDLVGHDSHDPGPGRFGRVTVRVEPASRIARALGTTVAVDCHHHQACGRLGGGLVPVAWASDGLVEAVEHAGLPYVVAVQWHPEQSREHAVFEGLVQTATSVKSGRM